MDDKKDYWNDDPKKSKDNSLQGEAEKVADPENVTVERTYSAYGEKLNSTGAKPIVVFFGPPSAGKTVAVLRLLDYLKGSSFKFPISNATPDSGPYAVSRQKFESIMDEMSDSVPPRTKGLDFLMLDARHNNKLVWHLLEAPGEHFFSVSDSKSRRFPRYMDQVFATEQKKVYVIFFEENMFKSPALRKDYSKRLANFINTKLDTSRDRIVVLYNKINDNPDRFAGGDVDIEEIREEIWEGKDYEEFSNAIVQNGQNLKSIPLVPYFSGTFYEGETTWQMSPVQYPKAFFDAIHNALNPRSKFRFW